MNNFIKAVDYLIHLHNCEQEGVYCGMPKQEDWIKAVQAVCDERQKLTFDNSKTCQYLDNVGGCSKTVGHTKCTCKVNGKFGK